MPSLAEVRRGLLGAWRLLLLDTKAVAYFDGTVAGGLRSFWVAAVVVPLYIAAGAIPRPVSSDPPPPHNVAVDLLGFLVSWPLLMVVVYGLVRWGGKRERFWLYVSASNWAQVLQSIGMLLVTACFAAAGSLVNLNSPETAATSSAALGAIVTIAAMFLVMAVFAYEWYVAWVSLDSGVALPIIVVLLDIITTLALDRLSTALA